MQKAFPFPPLRLQSQLETEQSSEDKSLPLQQAGSLALSQKVCRRSPQTGAQLEPPSLAFKAFTACSLLVSLLL